MAQPNRPKDPPPLIALPLTWDRCKELAARLSPMDAQECGSLGLTPVQSLGAAAMFDPGSCFAVCRRSPPHACVGAFGLNRNTNAIWSLWAPLGMREQQQVLKATREQVEFLAAGRWQEGALWNYVLCDNVRVIRWLRRAGCFRISDEVSERPDGSKWFYFEVDFNV